MRSIPIPMILVRQIKPLQRLEPLRPLVHQRLSIDRHASDGRGLRYPAPRDGYSDNAIRAYAGGEGYIVVSEDRRGV